MQNGAFLHDVDTLTPRLSSFAPFHKQSIVKMGQMNKNEESLNKSLEISSCAKHAPRFKAILYRRTHSEIQQNSKTTLEDYAHCTVHYIER